MKTDNPVARLPAAMILPGVLRPRNVPDGEIAYHFNRGFRCFGEEGDVTLAGLAGDGHSAPGQLACAIADYNGDGSPDLAVALAGGEVSCFYNDAYSRPWVSVSLKKTLGPITVSLWRGEPACCMGAAARLRARRASR